MPKQLDGQRRARPKHRNNPRFQTKRNKLEIPKEQQLLTSILRVDKPKKTKKEHKFKKKIKKLDKPKRTKPEGAFTKKDTKHPFQLKEKPNDKKSIIRLEKPKYIKPQGPLSKKELRERKRERKSKKAHGPLRCELNFLASSNNNNSSAIKLSKRPRKEQHEFVNTLVLKMKGRILQIAKKLDSTRTIQTAIKYGSQNQILQICLELKGHFIGLCSHHYSHKTVRALLEYGREKVRTIIIKEVMLAITRLILHRLAYSVVDYAIMVIADEKLRKIAFQYFISPKFIITTQYYDEAKSEPKTINDIIKSSDIVERKQILKNMEKFIISGFEKEIISTGIFQTILYYYIHNIYQNGKKMQEVIEFILPSIMELQNVKEGVMSIIYVINYSHKLKPKLRKLVIRNVADFIITMCCDKHSYLMVIKLLDIFDDTNLLKKHIIKKIINYFHILMFHNFGRLVLFHLLSPRNEKYFARNKLYQLLCSKPTTENERESKTFLQDNDSDEDMEDTDYEPLKQVNCKKNSEEKRMQLLADLLPTMIEFCCGNIKKILCHELAGGVLIELVNILLYDVEVKSHMDFSGEVAKLIAAIVDASILDSSAREISPDPPEPEAEHEAAGNAKAVEIHNVVKDSLKLVDSTRSSHGSADIDAKNATNLGSIDVSKMDPKTARNIYKLQQREEMVKNNIIYMRLNAEFEVKMIEYQLVMRRHKKKIRREDEKCGLMEHRLAHRRLRQMVEAFKEDFHAYFVDALVALSEEELIHFLSVKGVYVIWELYNCSSEAVKNKLMTVLKPVCVEMKGIIADSDGADNNYSGLKKLCVALDVDL